MEHVNPIITTGTGHYKAVCHKCQYVGFEPNTTTCRCGFPLLLEPAESTRRSVRDILDRSAIELKSTGKPPPLPGVNRSAKQKQQMVAEARRRLSTSSSQMRIADGTPLPAPAPYQSRTSTSAYTRAGSHSGRRQYRHRTEPRARTDAHSPYQRALTPTLSPSALSQWNEGPSIKSRRRLHVAAFAFTMSALVGLLSVAAVSSGF